MDDDDAVLVADGKTIQRHDVFGVIVFDRLEVLDLFEGAGRHLVTHLDIDPFVSVDPDEINLLGVQFPDVHLPCSSSKRKE